MKNTKKLESLKEEAFQVKFENVNGGGNENPGNTSQKWIWSAKSGIFDFWPDDFIGSISFKRAQ